MNLGITASYASGGIGIDLILRICTHFGWDLSFESEPGRGTKATLEFRQHS